MFTHIRKTNGTTEKWDCRKITDCIKDIFTSLYFEPAIAEQMSIRMTMNVIIKLSSYGFNNNVPFTKEVEDTIEKVLLECNYYWPAKQYMLKREHERIQKILKEVKHEKPQYAEGIEVIMERLEQCQEN